MHEPREFSESSNIIGSGREVSERFLVIGSHHEERAFHYEVGGGHITGVSPSSFIWSSLPVVKITVEILLRGVGVDEEEADFVII